MDAMLRDALVVRITCLAEILPIAEARYAWLHSSPELKVGLSHDAQNLDGHRSAIVYRKADSLVVVLAIQQAFEKHAITSGALGIAKHKVWQFLGGSMWDWKVHMMRLESMLCCVKTVSFEESVSVKPFFSVRWPHQTLDQ